MPRGAGFCPACGTAVNAPPLPFESIAVGSAVSERDVALGASRTNPKRGALVVAAVTVALVGGGLIAGTGSGDDGDEQVSPTPSTTVARPTTAEDRPTRTTVPRTTTTTTLPTYTLTPIPELGGAPLYAAANQIVIRIDTATGQSVVLGEGLRGADPDSSLLARAGGVVTWGQDVRFLPDDGSAPVSLGYGEVWPAADPELIWLRDYRSSPGALVRLLEVASGDEVAEVTLPAFASPIGDDGTGRFLVRGEAGSGAFTIDPATGAVSRLSDTTVVAASASRLLLVRCDDALVCGYELVDRSTGAVTAVPLAMASAYGPYTLDPTGRRVHILEYSNEGPAMRVVELSTGADEIQLGVEGGFFPGYRAPASWTADGQHLVLIVDSSLAIWTPGSDEPAEYHLTTGADGDEAVVTAAVVGL